MIFDLSLLYCPCLSAELLCGHAVCAINQLYLGGSCKHAESVNVYQNEVAILAICKVFLGLLRDFFLHLSCPLICSISMSLSHQTVHTWTIGQTSIASRHPCMWGCWSKACKEMQWLLQSMPLSASAVVLRGKHSISCYLQNLLSES